MEGGGGGGGVLVVIAGGGGGGMGVQKVALKGSGFRGAR